MSPETPSYVRFSPSPAERGRPPRPSIGKGDEIVNNLFDVAAPPSREIQSAFGHLSAPLSPPR